MSLTFTYHLLCMTWNMWHANPNLAEIYDADVSFNVQSKSESCTKERNIKHLKCSNSRLVIFVWGKYVDNFLQTFKISSWFQLLSLFVTQASSSLSLKDNVWEITGDRNLLGVRKKKTQKNSHFLLFHVNEIFFHQYHTPWKMSLFLLISHMLEGY